VVPAVSVFSGQVIKPCHTGTDIKKREPMGDGGAEKYKEAIHFHFLSTFLP